jgi:4-carboxymuconolactone decarboxylase
MSRLSELPFDKMDAEQQRLYERIAKGPRGRVAGPLLAWLRSPGFVEATHPMGEYLRYRSQLSGRLAELAILVVARHWDAEFEWFVHAPLAQKSGIAQHVIDSIGRGEPPILSDPQEATIWTVCTRMLQRQPLNDSEYQNAVTALGEARLVELAGLIGYYSLGAFTLNLFEIVPTAHGGQTLPSRSNS